LATRNRRRKKLSEKKGERLTMKKCTTPGCNNQIDEKYLFCLECVKKRPQKKETSNEELDILSGINNNLYAIRTILEYELTYLNSESGVQLKWNKQTKRFEIK
jgi:hypothetical protein